MYGIWIEEKHPTSKKAVKDYLTQDQTAKRLRAIILEDTSYINPGYSGSLRYAPKMAQGYTFVGPDPFRDRKFYGTVYWDAKSGKWKVK